jgi:hypothetical protein
MEEKNLGMHDQVSGLNMLHHFHEENNFPWHCKDKVVIIHVESKLEKEICKHMTMDAW